MRICLGQVSCSSLIVFLTKLFVNLLFISGCYRKFIFQKLLTNQMFGWEFGVVQQHSFWPGQDYAPVKFFESSSLFIIGSTIRDCEISNLLLLNKSLRNSTKVWQILPFLSKFPASLPCYTKRKWESHVCSRCKLWNTWFLETKQKLPNNLWLLLWRKLQFKSVCWYFYCWRTWWIEYYIDWAQLASSKQTWARRWAQEHAHCFLHFSPWCDASKHA